MALLAVSLCLLMACGSTTTPAGGGPDAPGADTGAATGDTPASVDVGGEVSETSSGDGDGDASLEVEVEVAGDIEDGPPTPFDAGVVATVQACEEIVLEAAADHSGPWRVVDRPLLAPRIDASGVVRLRAPSEARAVELAFVSDVAAVTLRVVVEPFAVEPNQAPGLVPDCSPFEYGVASGDPEPSTVLLWTRLTPPEGAEEATIHWEISESATFDALVSEGDAATSAERDWTVVVPAEGLSPATAYFYRFRQGDGPWSALGRTRTAPTGAVDRLRFAVVSCSSLWSGWFNAYRRIAERHELALVVHLGDYIYNSVDPEERIRMPVPDPVDPHTLEEHRARHQRYLLDPDLRAARAMHPWMVIWDNHDLEANEPPEYRGGLQAFREYVPMHQPDPDDSSVGYRTLRYGDLFDLVMLDVLMHRDESLVPGTEDASILGETQFQWLQSELATSAAAWRFVTTQKLLAPMGELPIGAGGSTWAGFPASRARLVDLIRDEGYEDIFFLSGDAHLTITSDIVADLDDPAYDATTGEGAVGVEFLPGSITRGNVDETIGRDSLLLDGLDEVFLELNPHYPWADLTRHGYGLIDVSPDRVIAEMWFGPILEPSEAEELGAGLEVRRGDNHWRRELRTEPLLP